MVGKMAAHFKTNDNDMASFCVGESPENAKYIEIFLHSNR